MISEKEIEHLAELSRIEISAKQKEKLARDLEEILGYVKELRNVDTSGIESMTGGTQKENALHDDKEVRNEFNTESAVSAFPEKKENFLKVPPVFE